MGFQSGQGWLPPSEIGSAYSLGVGFCLGMKGKGRNRRRRVVTQSPRWDTLCLQTGPVLGFAAASRSSSPRLP